MLCRPKMAYNCFQLGEGSDFLALIFIKSKNVYLSTNVPKKNLNRAFA
jgi:hypothetical protein